MTCHGGGQGGVPLRAPRQSPVMGDSAGALHRPAGAFEGQFEMCLRSEQEQEQEHEKQQEQEQEHLQERKERFHQGGDLRQNSGLKRASLSRIFFTRV